VNDDRILSSYIRGLKLQQRSAHTLRNYDKSLRMLRTFLDGVSLTEAGREDLEAFFEHRGTQVVASTVHGDYVNLRPFYNWLLVEEYISRNPMARIKAPAFEYKTPRVLSDAELKALFAACKGNRFLDKRDEAMLRLMSEIGGARRGEMVNMSLDDVDFTHDLVKLSGKTGTRYVPFGSKTGLALDRYLRVRDKARHVALPNLWIGYKGAAPSQTFWWVVKRRSELAGIGTIHPHTLRHTAAHRAMEAGMSEADMETLFGWSPGSAMTRVYGRATRVVRAQNSARNFGLGDKV
jgi:integrase/recombinase XerD